MSSEEEKVGVGVVVFIFVCSFLFLLFSILSSCCRYPKGVPVQFTVAPSPPCRLPPGPTSIPVPQLVESGCPEDFVCFDIENAAKLAARDGQLKQWIAETKARCSKRKDE
jgi:hypothetical protein